MEAFSIYSLFSGCVWMAHDQVFREDAVASKLVDWSLIDVQLYNFPTAGASLFGAAAGGFWSLCYRASWAQFVQDCM